MHPFYCCSRGVTVSTGMHPRVNPVPPASALVLPRVARSSDSNLVRIYISDELVHTHVRQAEGGRSTDHTHYPAEKTAYTMRDINWLINEWSSPFSWTCNCLS